MNVLVIAPHPDDEILGCGGTILRHAAQGDSLAWIIVTSILEEFGFSSEQVKNRQQEIKKIAKRAGIKKIYQLGFPTTNLHSGNLPEMIQKISQIFMEFQPDRIYIPNRSDVHSDHRLTFEATIPCTKSFRHPYIKQILMYETLSETEFAPPLPEKTFLPNYFINITEYLTQKQEIMTIYRSELGPHPFPRNSKNMEALALIRGATAGVQYAEAFQVIKFIEA